MSEEKKMNLVLTLADIAEGLGTMADALKLTASGLDNVADLLRETIKGEDAERNETNQIQYCNGQSIYQTHEESGIRHG